jgi:hypothetical protein
LPPAQPGKKKRKVGVRIDLNSDAAASATLLVSYTVRGARWSPIYDARLDTGGRDHKPSIDLKNIA